ncbi:MAG TPA: hypothetical protein VD928_02305 [Candidatus Paceibacterota bacterium]|nr:hypothetical protein [Candidatus Paceibacterota bacterium]
MKVLRKVGSISGATALAWLVTGIASAQTTTTTTPGVPNTGAGGDAMTNLAMLGISAAIAIIGLAYLSRRWAQS